MNKKTIGKIVLYLGAVLVLIGILVGYKTEKNSKDMRNRQEKEDVTNMKIYLKIKDQIVTATLENNSSVQALIEKLQTGDITIDMDDYAHMEKVGSLGFELPRNDENINTEAGDLILYQGNSFVIYYDTNRWNLTRLGKIDNISPQELKDILGTGSITVTLSLSN